MTPGPRFPQYRVNKTKQHTLVARYDNGKEKEEEEETNEKKEEEDQMQEVEGCGRRWIGV